MGAPGAELRKACAFFDILEEPQQRLAGRPEFQRLSKHQPNRLLDTAIRVLFQTTVRALDVPYGRDDDQFSSPRLLPPGIHRT